MEPDIEQMQRQHEDVLRLTNRWIIAETDEGFVVHVWSATGVAPPNVYPVKEMAAARLLQMMGIKHAILPQSYPEKVIIGFVADEDGERPVGDA